MSGPNWMTVPPMAVRVQPEGFCTPSWTSIHTERLALVSHSSPHRDCQRPHHCMSIRRKWDQAGVGRDMDWAKEHPGSRTAAVAGSTARAAPYSSLR